METKKVTDPSFAKYGRVLEGMDFSDFLKVLGETPLTDAVVYEPSVASLEALPVFEELQSQVYGEMPIQIGYCNGKNNRLNALEYHRGSEINIAADDVILLLGWLPDVTAEFTYDTSKVEAFLLPKGTAAELYGTTLHYAPCGVGGNSFRVAIVLPEETNFPLRTDHPQGEAALLTAKNKWLIGHPDGGLDPGVHLGLIGENIQVK